MRRSLLLAALLLSCGVAAHADEVLNFMDVTGYDISSFTGSITLDGAGTISAIDFTVDYTTQLATPNTFTMLSDIQYAGPFGSNQYIQIISDQGDQFTAGPPPGGQVSIVIPTDTLVGYTGGSLCTSGFSSGCTIGGSYTKNYVDGDGDFNSLYTGYLNFPSPTVTPEPSSLMLLGTGALGLIGAARRRLRR